MTERRLKILHVVRQFDPSIGGLEAYVKELAIRQAATNDVAVLTLNRVFGNSPRLLPFERADSLTIMRIPFIGRRWLFLPLLRPALLKDYDVIHVHCTDQLLDVISMISRRMPLKLFVTTHGLYFHTEALPWVKRLYLRTITKWSLRRTRAIFAVSTNDATTLENVGIHANVLHNPIVPLGDFICEGKDLMYLGRISANKRVDALIRFMAILVRERPELKLHIVGSDQEDLWQGLSPMIVREGLQKNILYHGYLEPNELIGVARTCGFTVSASRYEGFGLSVIEGMTIGLLPFMHRNDAFQETFNRSDCGLLTNFDDPGQPLGVTA
jgi:alpha-1,3-mannosyltransferase